MIKNSDILENFENQERQREMSVPWYQKADLMYVIGLKLNAETVKNGGDEHLKMLIDVREKMKAGKSNIP